MGEDVFESDGDGWTFEFDFYCAEAYPARGGVPMLKAHYGRGEDSESM